MKKELRIMALDDIRPYENNPRYNDQAVEAVAESIRQCEYIAPIVVDEDFVILAGHTRAKALERLGRTEAEVMIVTGLTDAQKRKYRLLDNKTNELADWDFDKLTIELDGLDFGGFDFGFDMETEELPEVIEDEAPEPPKEPKAKPGDIYRLGDHRLMCGDSTDTDAVAKLMDGERADICFTSPPYNMAASKGGGWIKAPNHAMHNGHAYKECDDSMSREDYELFLCNALENALAVADDALFNIGILCESKTAVIGMMHKFRDLFCDIIVWNKSQSMPHGMDSQKGMLSHRCEMIFAFNQNGSRSFTHPQWEKGAGINRIDTGNASGNEYSDVHAATFPVEFAFEVLKLFCSKSCLDLFGGTGTTLIAAEQLGRKCYMMELDPHYIDVIIERWENFTGKKAVLLNA